MDVFDAVTDISGGLEGNAHKLDLKCALDYIQSGWFESTIDDTEVKSDFTSVPASSNPSLSPSNFQDM